MMGHKGLFLVLVLIGTGWGLTQPLTKLAVSTGHGQFGLIFWQQVIMVSVLGAAMLVTGRGLPRDRGSLVAYGGLS